MAVNRIVRWLARTSSILSLAFVALMATSGGGISDFREAVGLLLFPIGVGTGLIVAWRYERMGGLLAILSLAAFYVWMLAADGRLPRGPYFALVTAPGLLFVASSFLKGDRDAHGREG